MPIIPQQLLQILPNAGKQAGVFASALNLAMDRFQINTRLRMAAFIAQVGHESGQFRYVLKAAAIPALPPQARQLPAPQWCLPTCSSALTSERATWLQLLTKPEPGA